jgi:heme-degrading monooxygenase HmoA
MGEIYTTGAWKPRAGKEDVFVGAWTEFAAWASGMAGAGTLRLTRDARDRQRFVSFGRWESNESVRAWKSDPDFRERLARVMQYVDEFAATELELIAAVDARANASVALTGAHAG